MNPRITVKVLVIVGCFFSIGYALDTVSLKDGFELKGDILKQTDKHLVIDMGFDVLSIPQTSVIKTVKDDVAAAQAIVSEHKRPDWQLYHTASLQTDTIEKHSERSGEAVVMVTSPGGQGSGFIINEQGYLITNFHVIRGETKLKITVFCKNKNGYEQKVYKKVRIVAFNPLWDLALLKIEEADAPFKYVCLGDTGKVEAGQEVFAIGNPLGLTRTVSQGIVSTPNRNYESQLYIQTTADINPGNSGGPLFNMKGEVIGVTSSGYIYLSGLNFAITSDTVKNFINNRDAFAYDERNPNAGYRYVQPTGRKNKTNPPAPKIPF